MYDVLVLAGGRSRRMGGTHKPLLSVGGRSLLDRVLWAAREASCTVVVGPEQPTPRSVVWTRESPVGAGPVAALAAGLVHVRAERVVLLAADLPFLDLVTVRLLGGQFDAAGRVFVDGGTRQWLCGGWRTAALREALADVVVEGARLRDVLGPLRPEAITSAVMPEGPVPWQDVDTPADLARAKAWHETGVPVLLAGTEGVA